MKTLSITTILALLLPACIADERVPTTIAAMDVLQWAEVAPGVWKATIGQADPLTPLNYAGTPKQDALAALEPAAFPFEKDVPVGQINAHGANVRIPLGAREKIYGLGLDFVGINRRKEVHHQHVDHYAQGKLKGRTHAPVPFYVSSDGYGVLVNTAHRPSFYVGSGNRKDSKLPTPVDRTTNKKGWSSRPLSDAVEVSVTGDGLEIFVFAGNNPLEAVQRYNLYCGGGVLPPRWGLGFWHRMHTQTDAATVVQEIADFEEHGFPLDVIGLEPGWQSFAYPCSFDWDPTRFPDPKGFLDTVGDKGIRINLWENPYISPESSISEAMKPYTGSHTVWLGEVADYTLPEAQKILLDHHQAKHLDIGVSGYKFDEVDGYDYWLWPDHATFPSGHDAVQIRQVYGVMIQNMLMNRFRELNQRTYGLVRSSNAGASNLGFVLYSDYYGHEGYITALVNSSFSGLLWTPEIRNADSGEEWVRRFQSVCFSPMLQLDAWNSGKKPWSYPEVTGIVRDVVELRTRLLPYLYTAFSEYNQKGVPPFRAMVLESGYKSEEKEVGGVLHGEKNPYAETNRLESTDQYMMGPSILVAPVLEKQKQRDVILPQGDWYDFYTGAFVGNGETITIKTKLEQIPLFVKDGGIIPMMPMAANLSKIEGKIPLEIRHYGKSAGAYELYDDDGETFDFEKGVFSTTRLEIRRVDGELAGSKTAAKGPWPSRYGEVSWVFMSE